MANHHRGEISVALGSRIYTLCLTLGALAELESAFAVPDLVSLANRFETGALSAKDLMRVIGCGIRGGGTALTDAEVAALPVENGLQGYIDIAAKLLAVTFGTLQNPQQPQA
jgi:hypothetical protein